MLKCKHYFGNDCFSINCHLDDFFDNDTVFLVCISCKFNTGCNSCLNYNDGKCIHINNREWEDKYAKR